MNIYFSCKYYIFVVNPSTVKLHKSQSDALANGIGINTIGISTATSPIPPHVLEGLNNLRLSLQSQQSQQSLVSSSTRREDLLLEKDHIQRIWVLRNYLADMNPIEAIEFMKDRLQKTKDNKKNNTQTTKTNPPKIEKSKNKTKTKGKDK